MGLDHTSVSEAITQGGKRRFIWTQKPTSREVPDKLFALADAVIE